MAPDRLAGIDIDAEAVLRGVRPWVECESPSWDTAAVNRMAVLAAASFRNAGARVSVLRADRGRADCVLAEFAPEEAGPGILVLCHLDTVHPAGALAWLREGNRCYGPGLFDMKAGGYLAFHALLALRGAGIGTPLPVRFLMTSDEESGSVGCRRLIEHHAARARYVLVPEGAQPNGNLVSGRFPVMRFVLRTRGKAAHALLQREEGRSAILLMARLVQAVEALNDPACSYTVNFIRAGQAIASVPLDCEAGLVSTARRAEDLEAAFARLQRLAAEHGGPDAAVEVYSQRPLWTPSDADRRLADHAAALARAVGSGGEAEMLFGGSDGNFTGAMGVPTLDGLGPVGADAHQRTEHILVDTLAPRGRLLAALFATLS